MAFIAILVSVISAYYYLQIIRIMHFDKSDAETTSISIKDNSVSNTLLPAPEAVVNNTQSYIISVLTLSLTLFMLKPSILLNSIHLMALNIFYT